MVDSFSACFQHDKNGTLLKVPTNETLNFDIQYRKTRACFKRHKGDAANLTCSECLEEYDNLTETYIQIQDSCGDSVCMDIVDTVSC